MTNSNETTLSEIKRHEDNLLIQVRGGTVAASRYEPVDIEGPLPIILMCVPYRKDDRITFGWHEPVLQYFARNGYEVIIADLLGSGGSSGQMKEPFDTATESPQVAEIVEWLANREWCTGSVGMYGHSWGGQTQLRAASENPQGLEAIVPVEPAIDLYDDGFYRGGIRESYHSGGGFAVWLHTMHALPPSRRDENGRWAEIWQSRLEHMRKNEPFLFQFGNHNTKDEYWVSKDVPVQNIVVPMLMVAGYRDYHPQSNIECFREAKGPKRLLLGPWRHGLPHVGRESAVDFRRQAVEWFDYHLKDKDNGAMDHQPIEYWTERKGGGKVDEGTWRGTRVWPNTHTDSPPSLSFSLTPTGLSPSTEFTDGQLEKTYTYDHTVGMESMDYLVDIHVDTNTDDARSLVFETDQFNDPVELTGTGYAKIRLKATTEHPILAIRLVDVDPDRHTSLVSYGYLRTSHGISADQNGVYPHNIVSKTPTNLESGQEYEITVPLRPKSHIFESGHKLRVAISASMFPIAFPDSDQGSFTILSDPEQPSKIVLPGHIHNEKLSFNDTVVMDPPDDTAVPVSSEFLANDSERWMVSRNYSDNKGMFHTKEEQIIHLPHDEVRMELSEQIEVSVRATKPETASIWSEHDISLHYPDEIVRAVSTAQIRQDTTQLETTVSIDNTRIFEETWFE